MSKVTFTPVEGTEYESGWPLKVIGDGFINLKLWDVLYPNSAIYHTNFEEYEFFDVEAGEWTVDVREDG